MRLRRLAGRSSALWKALHKADYAKLLIMQICRPESAPSLIDSGVRGFLALHNQMVFRKLISESGAR